MKIENTIKEETLPINSIAMANRLIEILKKGKTNYAPDLLDKDKIKYRKCLWLLNQQIFGQLVEIDMANEWEYLCNKSLKKGD